MKLRAEISMQVQNSNASGVLPCCDQRQRQKGC